VGHPHADVRRLPLFVAVLLVATVPYLNSLTAEFTFDDYGLVIDNPTVPDGTPAHRVFTLPSCTGGVYRPLTILSYSWNRALDSRPIGYHAVNVLLHAATTLLVLLLAETLLGSTSGAAIAALVFAVHPVHTEAVTSIAGRAEVLAAFFTLLALVAFVRSRPDTDSHPTAWMIVSLLAFAAALLSKENALTALPALALVHVWTDEDRDPRALVARCAPHCLVAVVYLAVRARILDTMTLPPPPLLDNPLAYVPAGPRLRTAIIVLWDYVSGLAFPLRLSADDSFDQIPVARSMLDARFLESAVFLTVLVVGAWRLRRRVPPLVFGLLFAAITLSLTANVVFAIGTIKGERLLYLPSVGWCLGIGASFHAWTLDRRRKSLVAIAVLAAFAGRTWVRNWDWHDEFSLFTAGARIAPNSARAQSNAAAVYGQRGDLDAAVFHYKQALAIYPDYAEAAAGAAHAYTLMNRPDEARRFREQAMRSSVGFTQITHAPTR
jgi:protein O-mannosyl-transferase